MITKKRTIGFLLIVGLLTVGVASAYAGNPFDRLDATFEEVKADLANLWTVVTGVGGLETNVSALEAKIAELETLIGLIPAGPEGPQGEPGPPGFGPPDYDSDWRPINKASTMSLEHGLGTQNLFIYVIGGRGLLPTEIHHNYYGYFNSAPAGIRGLKWEATSTHITLKRGGYDWDWENVRVYIWKIPTTLVDADSDGLSDILENEVYGTDPTNPDSDGDGLDDGTEVGMGTSPIYMDTDGDGLNDGEEVLLYLTEPRNPDTDFDSYEDGEEVLTHFTDPLDPSSHP